MLILVAFAVGEGALPIFSAEGFQFVIGTDWNAVYGRESFGALPYIIGTLLSSAIAMAIGVPISLGIAIFVTEMASHRISTPYHSSLSYSLLCPASYMAFGRCLYSDFG